MTPAQRTIAAALVVVGIFVTADEIASGEGLPPLRSYLGLVFAGIMLGILSEPAPGLAQALAALFALGVVLSRGPRVLASIGGS